MGIVSHVPVFCFKMKFFSNALLFVYFLLEASFVGANIILRTDRSTTVEGSGDIRFQEEDPRPSALEFVIVCTVLVVSAVGGCIFVCFCYSCQFTCRRDVPERTPLTEFIQLHG